MMGLGTGGGRWGLLAALALGSLQAVALSGMTGCRACSSQAAFVAKLAELHGTATRSAGRTDVWAVAPAGATFVVGDALRTGTATGARVELVTGGALRLGENTLVRFLARGDETGSSGLGVETGEAEVETGGAAMGIETPAGLARFEAGSRVRIHASATDSRFEVIVGRAEIEGDGGGAKAIESGQQIVVTSGRAVLETEEAGGPVEAAVPAVADASDLAAAPSGVQAEVRGAGVKVSTKAGGALAPLAEGQTDMAEGARIVVPDGATVAVTRGAERAIVIGHADVVVGRAGGPLLESRAGQVVLTSPSVGTRIDVPGGSIVLTSVGPGSRQAEVRVDRQVAHVTAEAGQIEMRGRLGSATVVAGESGQLDGKGAANVESNAPTAADLDVPSGESATIHSPRGAAAVRILLAGVCDGDALLEITGGRGKRSTFVRGGGSSSAVVALAVGSFGDRVRCVDQQGRPGEAKQAARLQVVRDSGAQPVPRTAPHDFVDADGRHYSVLYQNLLPQITMRWPRAPAGAKVSAHVQAAKGPQVFPAPDGSASAGALAEGNYTFWFEVDGDPGSRSPDTSLRVAFDNAAPAAELQLPVEGQAAAGAVQVQGVAVEGASVSVDGAELPLDPAFRFKGEVTAGTGAAGNPPNRSIAVRISHPSHGVHYYLRTIGGG